MQVHSLIIAFSCIGYSSCFIGNMATAQITPDTTLGNENSGISPNINIKSELADLIEGGAIRDTNLFHSFLEFNVGEGQRVFFANPDNVVNIFSRITGGNLSEIFGTLGVNGNANLFLINPNGILFGENASLDINGSFLASTAESIIFADGTQFSAANTQTAPLLTVSIPIGLQMGATPESIVNRSLLEDGEGNLVGLEVPFEKTLALIGGDVDIEGGFLTADAGRIEIGSVEGNNTVGLNLTSKNLVISYEGINEFKNVTLSQAAFVSLNTFEGSGGRIQIQGKQIDIIEGSQVFTFSSGKGQGADIIVKASESINISGEVEIGEFFFFSALYADAYDIGDGGNIIVETPRLTIENGGQIAASTFSDGNGGNLTVKASESVEISGTGEGESPSQSGLFTQVQATGDAGSLAIETRQLILEDGANIITSTFKEGNAGDLSINATELIEIKGTVPDTNNPTGILAQVEEGAKGNAGNLTINTGQLNILNGAQISNAVRDGGEAADLNITASDSILISGTRTSPEATLTEGSSGIFVSAEPAYEDESGNLVITTADAGELNITTSTLTVENGAKISADNFGTGKGGNATLNVERLIIRDGGLVRAGSLVEDNSVSNARGAGGTLTVNATELVEVTGTGTIGDTPVNSTLFTQAEGTGDAGNLNINTLTLTVKDGGEITASTLDAGKGGELDITAQKLIVSNGGTITAQTAGKGKAGNIILKIADNVTLSDTDSGLFANTEADSKGDGGSILTKEQTPETVRVEDGATIAVNSDGSGKGGSINFTAENITLDKGSITAETASNNGGNITLDVGNILSFENSGEITATAEKEQAGGDGGNITINADFILAFPTDNTYKITAEAFKGSGGNIEIVTKGFFGAEAEFVDISASSEEGVEGVVSINILEIDPARGLTELPVNIVDASQQITQGCTPKDRQESSRFIATGRGGLPLSPNEPLRGQAVVTNWVNEPTETISRVNNQSPTKLVNEYSAEIVEAQALIINDRGHLELVAELPANPDMPINIPCKTY